MPSNGGVYAPEQSKRQIEWEKRHSSVEIISDCDVFLDVLFCNDKFLRFDLSNSNRLFSRRIRSYRNISKALSEATEWIFPSTGYIALIEMQMKRCPFKTYLFYLTFQFGVISIHVNKCWGQYNHCVNYYSNSLYQTPKSILVYIFLKLG